MIPAQLICKFSSIPRVMDVLTHTLVGIPASIEDAHINFSLRSLETREDILLGHNEDGFETAFGQYFSFLQSQQLSDSLRTLYLLKNTSGSHG